MMVASPCNAARDGGSCGPFGDPPAELIGSAKPDCGKGAILGPWKDPDGTERYACLYRPASLGMKDKVPLLVYLHPSLFSAGTVRNTNLLALRDTSLLGANRKHPGFIVLAPQGRKTRHYFPFPDNRGMGWDNWDRQLNPNGDITVDGRVYRENVDAATIDHFIMQITASGGVDTRRIYVSGWSNGAAMGLLYALNRPAIAGVAVYSAPDPFGAFNDPCPQQPVNGTPADITQVRIFNPRVPVMHVHNSCDVAGICPNGEKLASRLRSAGVSIRDVIIDSSGKQVDACDASCGTNPSGDTTPIGNLKGWWIGLRHHAKWPNAWTRAMLEFLRDNPLQPARVPF
jgi:poly(3-hydroxybutyrate) depolymerase